VTAMTSSAPAATGQVEASRLAAEAAARAARVEVVELGDVEETAAVTGLFGAIWGPGSPSAMPAELLRALAHAGNYVAGAYDGDALVGAVVGFLGVRHDGVHLHSHVAGVLPRTQGRSVGFALKLHQRAWALARGIGQAEWTYDPLVRRNAYFNLGKLGATAVDFQPDFYGGMGDAINAGDLTDRCVAMWDLAAPRVVAAVSGTVPEPDLGALLAGGARVLLAEGEDGEPLARPDRVAPVLLCQVPTDIVRLRATRPALARAWRLAARETLGGALAGGWVATMASRSGWCVLEQDEDWA